MHNNTPDDIDERLGENRRQKRLMQKRLAQTFVPYDQPDLTEKDHGIFQFDAQEIRHAVQDGLNFQSEEQNPD